MVTRPSADESAVGDSFLEAETKKLIAECTPEVLNDSHLLKGRVPQCQDWRDAWVESTEQIAFHKQARCARKKNEQSSPKLENKSQKASADHDRGAPRGSQEKARRSTAVCSGEWRYKLEKRTWTGITVNKLESEFRKFMTLMCL